MKNVLLIGQRVPATSIAALFHSEVSLTQSDAIPADFSSFDVVIDSDFDLFPTRLSTYQENPPAVLWLHSLNTGVKRLFYEQKLSPSKGLVVGVNILPGFIDRPLLELCSPFTSKSVIQEAFKPLVKCPLAFCEDRVGLVSARILMMVINEAWVTLQEGTASKSDIDTGMKLGTNYPMGPFEWTKAIGSVEIVRTLNALFEDTHDSRYKVCSMLQQAVYSETF